MNCLNPFKRIYKDAITGEVKEVLCPCGHCINCLHSYQDMWAIRLTETAKYYGKMIYDTLTLNSNAVRCIVDFTLPTSDNTLYGSTERFSRWKIDAIRKHYKAFHRYYPAYSYETYKMLRKNDFKVYDFDKSDVQKWLKRGRIAYFRDKGKNAEFSYFICNEYGPKTSRPHFHVLFFGLDYCDYMKYFGNPWRELFGFTRPVYKVYSADSLKDFSCMVRYVSKYCSKGVFESPLVFDGLQKPPYKLISKGLGKGYLYNDFFSVFKSAKLRSFAYVSVPSEQVYNTCVAKLEAAGLSEQLERYKKYYNDSRAAVDYALACRSRIASGQLEKSGGYIDLSDLSDSQIDKLCIYRDAGGFPHALPVYYRNKLTCAKNNETSIYKFEVQNVLQSRARLHDNQGKAEVAASMGYPIPVECLDKDCTDWGLSKSVLFMVDYGYLVKQRAEAKALAERRYNKLKNLYSLGKMNLQNPACS